MKKVYQTTFGGKDAPKEEAGNCWQAAVASLLEIDLEEAFDIREFEQGEGNYEWFDEFNRWLAKYNLACIGLDHTATRRLPSTPFLGYHLAEFKSTTLTQSETHICIMHNGEVVHDPNPNAKEIGAALGIYLFVPLNPAEWSK